MTDEAAPASRTTHGSARRPEPLKHLQQHLPDQPIDHRRDAKFALAPAGLVNVMRCTELSWYFTDNYCSRIPGHVVAGIHTFLSMASCLTPAAPSLALTRLNAH